MPSPEPLPIEARRQILAQAYAKLLRPLPDEEEGEDAADVAADDAA